MPDPLDQAQQASAASIPALRAVRDAAAILRREVADNWANDVPDIRLRKVDPKALMLAILSDLTALADACERLAEENERLRGERVVLAMLAADGPAFSSPLHAALAKALRDRVLAEATPAPAGKGGDMSTGLTIDSSAPAGKGEG